MVGIEHPWFVIDLADYLFPGPDNDEPEATQFDEAAIAEALDACLLNDGEEA